MNFTISSSELLHSLLTVSRVISNKNQLAILDNFLFVLKGNNLEVTASDLEITLITTIPVDEVIEEGRFAVPAKLLTDSLKEFPDLPLNFVTNENEPIIKITWLNGASNIPYFSADDYPELPPFGDEYTTVNIPTTSLLSGISNTIYATAEEELRPIMNGIFLDIQPKETTFVASDSHKLVSYTRKDIKSDGQNSFILSKKTASILKSILNKTDDVVKILYNKTNAYFEFAGNKLTCRLIEGNYPAYKTVIPNNNPNKLYVNRTELLNASKRVAVCSNQATSHIKFSISFNKLIISAQDLSFSISAHETLNCQYDGTPMEIGFKSIFLIEILNNLTFEDVCLELSDPCRAGLIVNANPSDDSDDEIKALLMPVRIPV